MLCIAMMGAAGAVASAQTTMTINQPDTQVVYTSLRGGPYVNTNQGNDLETKTSPDMSVTRRGLLKFDTTTIPVGTPIASAKMTMTVQSGGATASRHIAAYQGVDSWDQTQATWNSRRTGQPWTTTGGDLGTKLDTQVVSNADGTKVTFDITPLVSQVVSGALGSSQYTRIELVDIDAADDQSRRIYYTPDDSNPANRPTLVLTFGSTSSTTTTTSTSSTTTSATTSMTIDQPDTQVVYTSLRGGPYANTNQGNDLETKTSADMSVTRRGLLKFDTTTIPVGTPIASAKMTMTVQSGGATASRHIAAYQGVDSWDQTQATWSSRRTGQPWTTTGGDLGTMLDTQVVSNADGTKVTFDLTPLVSQVVSGALGSSRYTRIELVDIDAADDQSRRIYYTPDDSNPANRPTLVLTFGSTSSSTSSTTSTTSTSSTTSGSSQSLRVLEWNIQHGGLGTDGVYDPTRIVSWVTKLNPDIVELVELESWDSYYSGDQLAMYQGMLEASTGVTWYTLDVQKYGQWTSGGNRLAILSKIPFSSSYRYEFSLGDPRAAGGVTITVNGRTINFMATHLDWVYEANRAIQAPELVSYANGFAQDRIIAGDFNADTGTPELNTMTNAYYDAWAVAKAAGTASSAPDNPYGYTRHTRIDYVFYSHSEQHLTLQSVTVVDTRDVNGVMPSDHRPLLAIFTVN
jgi:endonuclease/exonuclease/phosphatase family metal-dependent hydrolase